MGFYADFIAECKEHVDQWRELQRFGAVEQYVRQLGCTIAEAKQSITYFATLGETAQAAKIIKVGVEQCRVFLDTELLGEQDTRWLRLPFPAVWIPLEGLLTWKTAPEAVGGTRVWYARQDLPAGDTIDTQMKAILLEEHGPERWGTVEENGIKMLQWGDMRVPLQEVERCLTVHFLLPLQSTKLNTDSAVLLLMRDGRLLQPRDQLTQKREVMTRLVIHMVNFLASPSVKLVRVEEGDKLQKAREKRGKPPLPGWYEITYRRHTNFSKDKVVEGGWQHSFRYDVRGHFKRFEKGRMQGRVIWCPPHQRGLQHELYKPKTYRMERPADNAGPVWEG